MGKCKLMKSFKKWFRHDKMRQREMEETLQIIEFMKRFDKRISKCIYQYYLLCEPKPTDRDSRFLFDYIRRWEMENTVCPNDADTVYDREADEHAIELYFRTDAQFHAERVRSYQFCVEWCVGLLEAYRKALASTKP